MHAISSTAVAASSIFSLTMTQFCLSVCHTSGTCLKSRALCVWFYHSEPTTWHCALANIVHWPIHE